MYKLIETPLFKIIKKINEDGTSTSFNESNSELWQAFLQWQDEQPQGSKLDLSAKPNIVPEVGPSLEERVARLEEIIQRMDEK